MKNPPTLVCFGEILWDVLPESRKAGGAPMNVAYHFQKLGGKSKMISKIGDDELGRELESILQKWGLSTDLIQTDHEHNTSRVIATEGANHEMSYDILYPTAWDFIRKDKEQQTALAESKALVFGTLGMRHPDSRETLFGLLEESPFNVFDVNLRPPHYQKDHLIHGLQRTNLLKLNEHELVEISTWLNPKVKNDSERIQSFFDRFDLEEIIVTCGSKGADYYSKKETFHVPTYPVQVVDTIGSGDAFLAGFLSKKFTDPQCTPHEAMDFAALMGAFVAGNKGACPDYSEQDLINFKSKFQNH